MYTDEYLKLYGKLVEVNRQIKEADKKGKIDNVDKLTQKFYTIQGEMKNGKTTTTAGTSSTQR